MSETKTITKSGHYCHTKTILVYALYMYCTCTCTGMLQNKYIDMYNVYICTCTCTISPHVHVFAEKPVYNV